MLSVDSGLKVFPDILLANQNYSTAEESLKVVNNITNWKINHIDSIDSIYQDTYLVQYLHCWILKFPWIPGCSPGPQALVWIYFAPPKDELVA